MKVRRRRRRGGLSGGEKKVRRREDGGENLGWGREREIVRCGRGYHPSGRELCGRERMKREGEGHPWREGGRSVGEQSPMSKSGKCRSASTQAQKPEKVNWMRKSLHC